MKEGTSVEAHIKDMKKLADRLAAIKAVIADTHLESLPPSYSTLVLALEARDSICLRYVQQTFIHEKQDCMGITN